MTNESIINALRTSLQEKIGDAFQIQDILAINPIMTEVSALETSSGKQVFPRIYRLDQKHHQLIHESWEEHAYMLPGMQHDMLARSQGLKQAGPYLAHVFEAPANMDLASYRRLVDHFQPELSIRTAVAMLTALEQVYMKGAAHFQIRPDDVLVLPSGGLALKNHGLYDFESEVVKQLGLKGLMDPTYLTPEHFGDADLTVTADIYQVGLVLFEIVTGRKPFEGDYSEVLAGQTSKNIPDPRTMAKGVNIGLARVLMRALAKKKESRFLHLSEFKQALAYLLPAHEREAILHNPNLEPEEVSVEELRELQTTRERADTLAVEGDFRGAMLALDPLLRAASADADLLEQYEGIYRESIAGDLKTILAKAQELFADKKPAEALTGVNQALNLAPRDQEALELRAVLFESVSRDASAFHPVLDVKAVLARADELERSGNLDLAVHLRFNAQLAEPGSTGGGSAAFSSSGGAAAGGDLDLESEAQQVREFWRTGRFQEASTKLSALMASHPNAPEIADLQSEMDNSFRTRPLDDVAVPLLAYEAERAGDAGDEAATTAAREKELQARVDEVEALLASGDYTEALAQAEEGLRRFPASESLKALINKASDKLQKQTLGKGVDLIEQFILSGDFKKAADLGQRLLKAQPNDERIKQALKNVKSAYDKHRYWQQFLSKLAEYEEKEDYKSAMALVAKVAPRFPDSQELEEIQKRIHEGMQNNGPSYETVLKEALPLARKGDEGSAVKVLRAFLQRRPNHKEAAEVLASLESKIKAKQAAPASGNLEETIALTHLDPERLRQTTHEVGVTEALTIQPPPIKDGAPPLPPPISGTAEKTAAESMPPKVDTVGTPPPVVEKVTSPKGAKQKPGSMKAVIIAVAAVVVLGLAGAVGWYVQSQAKKKAEAEAAYAAADQLEGAGDWGGAVSAWRGVVDQHEAFSDSQDRLASLQERIKQRADDLKKHLEIAALFIEQGVLHSQSGESAASHLNAALALDPESSRAEELYQNIERLEMERARLLYDEGHVLEANEVYQRLREIRPKFEDQAFQAELSEWIHTNIIAPDLELFEKAVAKQDWGRALEVTERLKGNMPDASEIDARWHAIYADFEARLAEAVTAENKQAQLRNLEVMTKLRPDDVALVEQKDLLSRELNTARIENTEARLQAAINSKDYRQMGLLSNELRGLDSTSKLATETLVTVTTELERQIDSQGKETPREALKTYDTLILIMNRKSYRDGRQQLRNRIVEFDNQVDAFEKQFARPYEELNTALTGLLDRFSDFKADPKYVTLNQKKAKMVKEQQRKEALLEWERTVRNDVNIPYQTILDKVQQDGAFEFEFARQKVAQLIAFYDDKIENYSGEVTLVMRSAKNLPDGNDIGNRSPEAFCELTVGGQTFKTKPIENNNNPVWNESFKFTINAGDPLLFKVYDDNSFRKQTELGAMQILKTPKTQKNLTASHQDGWALTFDVQRKR